MEEAELLHHVKKVIDSESLFEAKVWKVPKSKQFPEGLKYSLNIIEKEKRIIGYDNERGKGHHKHVMGKEEKFEFESIDNLMACFEKDLEEYKKLKKYDN